MSANLLRRLGRDDRGTTLVELAVVLALFLMLFFAVLEGGRVYYHWVTAQKAIQVAARIAAVRPAACPGVPNSVVRASGSTAIFGTRCNAGGAVCATVSVSCTGTASNATAAEIWSRIRPVLPPGATIANLRFAYQTDPNLGFLGGPLVPVVTVELQNLSVTYVLPIWGLARMAGANVAGTVPNAHPLPSMSVSLPGEDLALGTNG